jgi:DNA-binding MarR family transcriptional regulator
MEEFILDQSVGYTLNIVANLLKRELNDELQRAGIDILAEQWALLYRLHERGSMNQQELAASLSRDNGSVTRTVLVLEGKQLLERRQVDQDRRHRYLYLTPAGQQLVPRLIACAQRGLQRATQDLTPQEVAQLNHLIQKMTRNLSH